MDFDKRDCTCGNKACDGRNHRILRPNERCSCGSGKKYKKCCGGRVSTSKAPVKDEESSIPKGRTSQAALIMSMMALMIGQGE